MSLPQPVLDHEAGAQEVKAQATQVDHEQAVGEVEELCERPEEFVDLDLLGRGVCLLLLLGLRLRISNTSSLFQLSSEENGGYQQHTAPQYYIVYTESNIQLR